MKNDKQLILTAIEIIRNIFKKKFVIIRIIIVDECESIFWLNVWQKKHTTFKKPNQIYNEQRKKSKQI